MTDHIPAARAFVNAVAEFLDGLPFSTEADARKLRIQAAGVMRLLPPDPPAELLPLAEACAIADGACRRFIDRCEDFDADLHWPESAVFDLTGVAYHLAEIGDHLPPVPAAVRDTATASDNPHLSPGEQLAAVLVRLEDVELEADGKAHRLPLGDPLAHRLRGLVWCLQEGTGCLSNEVLPDTMTAAREQFARHGV